MLNYIWSGLLIISLITAIVTGRISEATTGILTGASDAVTLSFSLLGAMCLWTGLMKIAEKSGLINIFGKILKPIISLLFPKLPKNSPSVNSIIMNVVANLLGMCNVATPLGINAMRELQKINKSETASREMCTFAILNTASIQIIPTTLITMRIAQNSQKPFEIIPLVWIASFSALIIGLIFAKIFEKTAFKIDN